MLFDIFCCVFRKPLSLLIALSTFYIDFLAHFLFFILNCINQAGIKTKSPVQVLFFEKQVKCQILLGNFKKIKSKQRKHRVRKRTAENFSTAIFCIFMWDYFPLQGNVTFFANITQKNNFTFSQSFYLSHQLIFLLFL